MIYDPLAKIEEYLELPALQESAENKRKQILAAIDWLIVNDFHKLVYILYRVDVSEKKIENVLASRQEVNAAVLILDLIMEREEEKIKSRKENRVDGHNEEEKW